MNEKIEIGSWVKREGSDCRYLVVGFDGKYVKLRCKQMGETTVNDLPKRLTPIKAVKVRYEVEYETVVFPDDHDGDVDAAVEDIEIPEDMMNEYVTDSFEVLHVEGDDEDDDNE